MADEPEACYNSSNYETIAAFNTASAFISLLICLLVSATIIGFKKYVIFTQRLSLYLCIAGALNSFATVVVAKLYLPMNNLYNYEAYCAVSGYFLQSTFWMVIIALSVIVIDMYKRVVYQAGLSHYDGADKCHYELLRLIAIFIVPVLVNTLPFIENSYGQAGPWCWIRTVNNDANCSAHLIGSIFRGFLTYGFTALFAIGAVIIYILIVRHLYMNRYTGKYNPHMVKRQKQMLMEALPFLIYPWLFLLITLVSLVNGLVHQKQNGPLIVPLWVINATVSPQASSLAAILFGVDFETLGRLLKSSTYKCSKRKAKEYPCDICSISDSLKPDAHKNFTSEWTLLNT